MTHLEMKAKFLKAFGGKVPYAARDTWAEFLKAKATRYALRYDWVTDPRFWLWISKTDEIDFDDGQEWITVFSC